MSGNRWRSFRTGVRYAVYVGCVLVVAFPIFICGSILMNPDGGFGFRTEFDGLSGRAAKRRLPGWPAGVAAGDVEAVSYKSESSRDSHSKWIRIRLTEDAASIWMDHAHQDQENSYKQRRHHLHEGVHRTVVGPPPQRSQTGITPTWWNPPSIDFRATEVMLWYTDYDSGVGRATYSAFDESTGALWVYSYACQHDLLWTRGNPPTGTPFSKIEN